MSKLCEISNIPHKNYEKRKKKKEKLEKKIREDWGVGQTIPNTSFGVV